MHISRGWIGMIAAAALLLPSPVIAQISPADTVQRTVVTEKSAYLALPPELVAEPVVMGLNVSNGGRYALAQRMRLVTKPEVLAQGVAQAVTQAGAMIPNPQTEFSLVLWDSSTHRSTVVWHADAEEMHPVNVAWMQTAEIAFVQVIQSVPVHPEQPQGEKTLRPMLLRIAPPTSRADIVDLSSLGQITELSFDSSPTVSLAVVSATRTEGDHRTTSLSLLDAFGRIGAHTDLPPNAQVVSVRWSKNNQPFLSVVSPTPNGEGMKVTWLTMNTRTGELSPLPNPPKTGKEAAEMAADPKPAAALPLRLKTAHVNVKEAETTQTAGLLWLESVDKSEKPRILLSSDSTGGQLMARGRMALFQSQGAVWATPLLPIDRAVYTKLMEQADRTVTMSHAKQAALALILFAQANGDILPGSDGLADNLAPYAPDPSVLNGFNYTYPGGPLGDIAKPSETVIGTMTGTNGQAIIYADGHVTWR